MYLKDLEPLLVVFGYFVCSHQLNVVAISRVADNVILHRERSFQEKVQELPGSTNKGPGVQGLAQSNYYKNTDS